MQHEFVETWKSIAVAVGRSERWCRYMAQRPSSPLPVFKVGGIVRLNLADLASWIEAQRADAFRPQVAPALALVA